MNILIIDDQTLLRTGMRLFLETISADYQLFEAPDLKTARAILKEDNDIRVVITEVKIEGLVSPEIIKLLKSVKPGISILFYSGMSERIFALPALRAGAEGFVMKRAKPDELAKAIAMVGAGGKYMSVELQASLITMIDTDHQKDGLESLERLSHRERAIMTHVVQGKTTKEIAFMFNLKCNTVSTYKKRIYKKMNVTDTFELAQKAVSY
ncbi:DNA-binding response regulator, NarL/FixJ family, contains REC and HTH domains [Dyadobacter sp. SG02]|uniref:response regulator n=1 Tax=Dyadobacter sp. SG02 TaxID=1855291 RepID=UPI0008B59051|nr:response regulator transcription factor [Dyadobacter sp. SG02]SEJ50581.1 DNA-binding response regulator, NarL/FixJ family, contains REC and HTH domains [Dyadobacter sp. SG02]